MMDRMIATLRSVLLATVIGLPSAATAADSIRMTTLDWPPFAGSALPSKGLASAIMTDAMAAGGVTLEPVVLDWTEALKMAAMPEYVGVFPAYAEEVPTGFLTSDMQFSSPLQAAQRKDRPATLSSEKDLTGRTVGVVKGYGNTKAFDALRAGGAFKTVEASDDTENLKNLLDGKVDVAMIDRNVFLFVTARTPDVKARAAEIELNSLIFEQKKLFAAFPDTDAGRSARRAFEKGLARTDVDSIYRIFVSGLGR